MDLLDIPTFTGDDVGVDLEFWIKWMEQYFSEEGDFTENQKLAMAWGFISRDAAEVWLVETEPFETWETLKKALRSRFGEADISFRLCFREQPQQKESAQIYTFRKQTYSQVTSLHKEPSLTYYHGLLDTVEEDVRISGCGNTVGSRETHQLFEEMPERRPTNLQQNMMLVLKAKTDGVIVDTSKTCSNKEQETITLATLSHNAFFGVNSPVSTEDCDLSIIERDSKSSLFQKASDLKFEATKVDVYHNSVIYRLTPSRYATGYGCYDATIILRVTGKAVGVEHYKNIHVMATDKNRFIEVDSLYLALVETETFVTWESLNKGLVRAFVRDVEGILKTIAVKSTSDFHEIGMKSVSKKDEFEQFSPNLFQIPIALGQKFWIVSVLGVTHRVFLVQQKKEHELHNVWNEQIQGITHKFSSKILFLYNMFIREHSIHKVLKSPKTLKSWRFKFKTRTVWEKGRIQWLQMNNTPIWFSNRTVILELVKAAEDECTWYQSTNVMEDMHSHDRAWLYRLDDGKSLVVVTDYKKLRTDKSETKFEAASAVELRTSNGKQDTVAISCASSNNIGWFEWTRFYHQVRAFTVGCVKIRNASLRLFYGSSPRPPETNSTYLDRRFVIRHSGIHLHSLPIVINMRKQLLHSKLKGSIHFGYMEKIQLVECFIWCVIFIVWDSWMTNEKQNANNIMKLSTPLEEFPCVVLLQFMLEFEYGSPPRPPDDCFDLCFCLQGNVFREQSLLHQCSSEFCFTFANNKPLILELEDKPPLKGGSIDRSFRVYFHKHSNINGQNKDKTVTEKDKTVIEKNKETLGLMELEDKSRCTRGDVPLLQP